MVWSRTQWCFQSWLHNKTKYLNCFLVLGRLDGTPNPLNSKKSRLEQSHVTLRKRMNLVWKKHTIESWLDQRTLGVFRFDYAAILNIQIVLWNFVGRIIPQTTSAPKKSTSIGPRYPQKRLNLPRNSLCCSLWATKYVIRYERRGTDSLY